MRLSHLFGSPASRNDDVAGVTIDVMTGIVAGIALVLAILILANSLRHAPRAPAGAPASITQPAEGA